ncbi:MAG TPA: TetR/AcrR family transcriptional regulator [Ktedonobacterales bacterium]|nr:TetR/AcrR family transcriptional regulator [Ktedonobacterales bacterium]
MNETDPRVKRTRKLLLEAFEALLEEKSFHDISVQDIAERATINRATFYAHFVDKYALLDEAFSERFRATVSNQVSLAAPFTAEHLARLIAVVFASQAEFHDHCQHQTPGRDLNPMMEAKVQQELNAWLLEWLRRSPPPGRRGGMTESVLASVLSWAIFGAAAEWTREARRPPAEGRARQVAQMLIGGLGPVTVAAGVLTP